ncbi:alpha/beta fold hydrolase [Pseudonocardia asaccharolytica]|uniref:Carboxylesterase n=1 Tax=Pseudonocardia asaccharolytica DSM 44247 = NBRC 16224 TaxID=1123024 RepID=A0A511D0L3_9PSEU|nr:alpha/beta hydrolase [Pseudonocardia asaccharolytica]GEL18306.1 carboxylesterase [Pseudonocardia asaccharolytica DSM 44247 = NBRC 16224]
MTALHEPVTGRYVYVPHGGHEYRIYYEEAGDGIPLVCLHTAGTDAREWRHQLNDADITSHYRVIAFDMPRHGKSIPPVGFEREEYRLTATFYSEFVMAFCDALELERPVVMGSSMGGNICLHIALNFEEKIRALIAIEACDHSPGWYISWLEHPHVHGGEACATSVYGLMAPQSPDEYRWETWWYYAQGGPGIFKGDLYFYSVDHDFRKLNEKITGNVPLYLMTGVYDFACTPEMTEATAQKIKGAESIIMEEIGHFPMSENPVTFKRYLMPVLETIRGVGSGGGA